jgi:hypothetical protein
VGSFLLFGESINKIAIVGFLLGDWNQGKKALIMVFALLFGGVELRYSKRECLRFLFRHAFARSYTAFIAVDGSELARPP